ncbi:hypothetical protein VP1G_11396 [Cytospora mali]|uniref:Uncharacterized protein n=1 Tax=Cytospora mali TaxID=578113 RepID=A0A194VF93_CYTMA|nr:hypothetical protein VP1G_11396 [Valsa mali var. pyri (nom. inval.)]
MAADLGARVIYELPLFDVQGGVRTINIKPVATDGCIRLVDCVAFAVNNILKIWEFPEPPLQEAVPSSLDEKVLLDGLALCTDAGFLPPGGHGPEHYGTDMGLMGVSLNPADFNEDDRLKATLALASSIMNSGGSADWLGLPARIPPCPQMSTFPQFARTDVTGRVEYLVSGKWCPARSLDDWFFAQSSWTFTEIWPWERLYGSMDENGYLIFTRKSCTVIRETATIADQEGKIGWPLLEAADGTVWRFLDKAKHSPETNPREHL